MSNEGESTVEHSSFAAQLSNKRGYQSIFKRTDKPTEALIRKHTGMVYLFARKYAYKYGMEKDLEDFVSVGYIALLHAWSKFDDSLGYKFTTYLGWWLIRYMGKFVNENYSIVVKKPRTGDSVVISQRKKDLELNKPVGKEMNEEIVNLLPGKYVVAVTEIERQELCELIRQVARLVAKNSREMLVVERRMLTIDPETFEELSGKLNITKQGVALMENKLKRRIRERLMKSKKFKEIRSS
jgi:RNA polymerase sigma factor (sigma-70 family)